MLVVNGYSDKSVTISAVDAVMRPGMDRIII